MFSLHKLPESIQYLSVFLSSMVLSLALTYTLRKLSEDYGFYALPGERKIHSEPVPNLGGIAVFLSFIVPLCFMGNLKGFWVILITTFLVTTIGFIDDRFDLGSVLKLMLLAGIFLCVSFYGIRISTATVFVPAPWNYYVNSLLLAFWGILVVSAINAIDNMDGLAPGVGLIACLMFFLISLFQFPDHHWALYSIALIGALGGFLPYNFYPASIFLGDSGSFLIGTLLALLPAMTEWSQFPLKSMIVPMVILSIPIMDLIFLVFFRYLTGETDGFLESVEYSAQDHLSHRIQQVRDFGQPRTVTIIYALATVSGLLGVIMRNTQPFESVLALLIVAIMYFIVIVLILPSRRDIDWRWVSSPDGTE